MLRHAKSIIKSIFRDNNFLLRDSILLESSPDYADNTLYVFRELIRKNINERHPIYWLLSDNKTIHPTYKNVHFLPRKSLRAKFAHFSSKYIIDSNDYVKKIRTNQYRIFLGHGSPLKMAYSYLRQCGSADVITISSDFFTKPTLDLHGDAANQENIKITGLARCDGLLNDVHPKTEFDAYSKVIIWMPTFRNHKSGAEASVTNIRFKYGVPIIASSNEFNELNTLLRKNNAALIIWRHPAEDICSDEAFVYSNIKLFDRKDFEDRGIQLYDFLKETDALITDYSSIYYDYLLLRKPIGLAVPDLAEYSKHYSFVDGGYKNTVKGSYINDFSDLQSFITSVTSGKARFSGEMRSALKKFHKYQDAKSSERVVDILIAEMEKK